MKNLHGWVFHHNDYTGLWAAFRTTEQQDYWNKMYPHKESKALFNKDIMQLIEVVSNFQPSQIKTVYEQFGLFDHNNG